MGYTFFMQEPVLSVIIPVFHEQDTINTVVKNIYKLQVPGCVEVIVADGTQEGSTLQVLEEKAVPLLSLPGRARQMNAGAKVARARAILFLHADTILPANALIQIIQTLEKGYVAGAFELSFEPEAGFFLRIVACAARWRTRLTKVPYGDQAHFFSKAFFTNIGGYKDIPIMEDIDIFKRIKKQRGKICILKDMAITSSRRYKKEGPLRRVIKNVWIRLLYHLGVSPVSLKKLYTVYKKDDNT